MQGKGKRATGWWQMALLAFTTTFREGLESVIFLTGVSAGIDPKSIPIAGLVGIALGVAVGMILFYTCALALTCIRHARPLALVIRPLEAEVMREEGLRVLCMTWAMQREEHRRHQLVHHHHVCPPLLHLGRWRL
jgi:hypothetical protein